MSKKRRLTKILLLLTLIILGFEAIIYLMLKRTKWTDTNNPSDVAIALASECDGYDWQECYGEKLKRLIKDKGIELALKVREEAEKIDKKTLKCHVVAHYMAIANVETNPNRAFDLFKHVNPSDCAYGFVHGIIEGLNRYNPQFEISDKSIPEICRKISEAKNLSYIDQGCLHAMGHLALAENCNENIEEGIRQATEVCSKLSQNLRKECYGGIFMESFTRDNLNVHCNTPHINLQEEQTARNQEKICLSYSGEKASACWQEISHIYLALSPFNPGETLTRCGRAPNKEDAANCYIHIVGAFAWKDNLVGEYSHKTLCAMYNNEPEFLANCYKTAVRWLLYTSLEYLPQAKNICLDATGTYKDGCFDVLIETLVAKTKLSKNPHICDFPPPYKTRCQNAFN